MHGTLQIKIFVNSNIQALENAVNTFLTQQNLAHENFVDMKTGVVPGTTPTGYIVVIYKG